MEKNYIPDMDLVHCTTDGQCFYIGSLPDDYHGLGVDVIVSCTQEIAKNPSFVEVLHIPFRDTWYKEDVPSYEKLSRWLKAMYAIIDGRNVLIHCNAGMNRSGLMTALYLWEYHREDFLNKKDMINKLREARPLLLHNSNFEKVIEGW